MKKLIFKNLMFIGAMFVLIMASAQMASANPEMGREIHFVLDPTNANHEVKMSEGKCKGAGVVPRGDGTAWAENTCTFKASRLPWYDVEGFETAKTIIIQSLNGVPCEMFDYSNNAGNNQGYNVTQYDAAVWKEEYRAKEIPNGLTFKWNISMYQFCDSGA